MLARASAWASKNPLAAGGIVLAAGGVAYTLYRIASNETFADSDHTVTEEQKAEAERVRSVLDEIGATGVFSVDEAALFSSEFLSSIRSRSRRSVSVDESTGEEVCRQDWHEPCTRRACLVSLAVHALLHWQCMLDLFCLP